MTQPSAANPTFAYERGVEVPMRDGTRLNAVMYRPTEGTASTLLVRTPYGVSSAFVGMAGNGAGFPNATSFVDAGFAVIWVEARGTFGSEGTFRPKVHESQDGYDTIEWIVAQPWSDGRVAMYGPSYLGITQWAAAIAGHPSLKAIAPMQTAMESYKALSYHPGGALSLSAVTSWHALMYLNDEVREITRGNGDMERISALIAGLTDQLALNDGTPLADHPLFAGRGWLDEVLEHPDYDVYWDAQDFSPALSRVTVPVLAVAGWFDPFIGQQLRDFENFQKSAGSAEAVAGSRLIVGPWDHDPALSGHFRDHDFGLFASAGAADLTGEHIRHFQRWLGPDTPSSPLPSPSRVKLFVMGVDEWRDFDDWPIPEAQPVPYYLASGTEPGARHGKLSTLPAESEHRYEYSYDPADPVPTTGGAQIPTLWGFSGPADQRPLDSRPDVLSFQTAPLDHDTEVIGHISATLFVQSDALDTDFTAKLIDVHPDGKALGLCDGILRMRYRTSPRTPELTQPGEVYEISIDMAATADVFRVGHRIRVDISSSNFPRFDRNTNTGGLISRESIDDAVVAHNAVLTGPQHPSRIILPVLRG
ncbi:CocE/NonD family hydrolase [Acrocarpospora macrocephala]|uniref:X-Pro dipeptidyl-peptidase n=1 Tax=Acrocarpospora macrocephala TaxID=150177 RepID=A0A5M3WTC3_9ACTN|nr:CocE/NonD family hydrolase [Acrocarpospora macrocephala]GES12605.1 X-Pro dipeptidyl-peptidase [Acrocarpospora macrocephala]